MCVNLKCSKYTFWILKKYIKCVLALKMNPEFVMFWHIFWSYTSLQSGGGAKHEPHREADVQQEVCVSHFRRRLCADKLAKYKKSIISYVSDLAAFYILVSFGTVLICPSPWWSAGEECPLPTSRGTSSSSPTDSLPLPKSPFPLLLFQFSLCLQEGRLHEGNHEIYGWQKWVF